MHLRFALFDYYMAIERLALFMLKPVVLGHQDYYSSDFEQNQFFEPWAYLVSVSGKSCRFLLGQDSGQDLD